MTDRVELLRAADLEGLLEDLGDARGLSRRGRQYPCPSVDHEQSGRTPPVSVSGASEGYGIWHCHSCGAGGTAVDALLVSGRVATVSEAFGSLDQDWRSPAPVVRPATPRAQPSPVDRAAALEELDAYVDGCERRLHSRAGRPALDWLTGRGLDEGEIRRNRIGFDPGVRAKPRPRHELPAPIGPAVTLPMLGADDRAIYVQARQLDTNATAKYLNPSTAWIGSSPRVGLIRQRPEADDRVLVVTEGIIDAMSAGRCFAACAVIGAKQADADAAGGIVRLAKGRPVVICFDSDRAGRDGATELARQLDEQSDVHAVTIFPRQGDLNDLLRADSGAFTDRLSQTVRIRLASTPSQGLDGHGRLSRRGGAEH